jgi:hypothetical protein
MAWLAFFRDGSEAIKSRAEPAVAEPRQHYTANGSTRGHGLDATCVPDVDGDWRPANIRLGPVSVSYGSSMGPGQAGSQLSSTGGFQHDQLAGLSRTQDWSDMHK